LSTVCVGLVCSARIQQLSLAQALADSDLQLGPCLRPEDFLAGDARQNPQADAWIVDVSDEQGNEAYNAWLETVEQPIIFGDGCAPDVGSQAHTLWFERILAQLVQLKGSLQDFDTRHSRQQNVCVLAASTGGPAAVKTFLAALPKGLDISFIYVQHIDAEHDQTLLKMMSANSHYPAYIAAHGERLQAGRLALMSPATALNVLDNGTFCQAKNSQWLGAFSPSIDQVIANVSSVYGAKAGAIVFTGMGEDGLVACRLLAQQGGYVWAQTPESCVVGSMPEAVIAAKLVSFYSTPEGLARHLANSLNRRKYTKARKITMNNTSQ